MRQIVEYSLDELSELNPEVAITDGRIQEYSLDEIDNDTGWDMAREVLNNTVVSFSKGFASDIVRIPGEIGQLIKESGEKGGAAYAIPSFNDGVNIARQLTSKEIELGKVDEFLINAGQMLSEKNKEFADRLSLKPEEGSRLSQLMFDLGAGASSVATSIGLLYATRSPSLLFGLFGARQKAQIYEESRSAGKDPLQASMLSNLAGLVEGGVEALGGLAFLRAVTFDQFLVRALLRAGEQGLEEAFQQTGEELITKIGGVRKDSFKDSILRIGYASALGFVLGVPAGAISSAVEKTQVKQDLNALGFNDEQAAKLITKISEKTIEDGTVKQEIARFIQDEIKNTETAINENPSSKKIDAGNEVKTQGQNLKANLESFIASISEAKEKGATTREKIFEAFENTLLPIAQIAEPYASMLGAKDPFVYSGKAYFVDHHYSNHPKTEIKRYSTINEVLTKPDEVKKDPNRNGGFVFIKKYDKYHTVAVNVGSEGGKLVLYKTFFTQNKKPYEKFPSVGQNIVGEGDISSISPASEEAPAEAISALPTNKNIPPSERRVKSDEKIEDSSAKLEAEAREIQKKIDTYQKAGKPIPESLIKRKEALSYEKKNIETIAKEALDEYRYGEKVTDKPNKKLKNVIREKTGKIDQSRKVSEMKALKESLKRQSQAAMQATRSTKKDLKAVKQGLVDTIKQYIPASNQGKFLGMIARAEDGRAIVETSSRIEKLANEIHRKELVKSIKRQAKRFNASKSIAIDYVQRINDILDKFDLQSRREDTIQSLRETQRFIDEQRKQGEDVSMPQYVLNRLKILGRKPLDQIDTAILENISKDIQTLADLGKTKLRSRQAFDAAQKERDLLDLQSGSKKIENKEILTPKVGEELSLEQTRKNTLAKTINAAMSLNLSITPMDVIFDVLDGSGGYSGPNYRIFKKTIDQAYSNYLDKKDSIVRDVVKLANYLNLKDSNFERIGFYAAKVQEGGIEKLESLGFTQDEIDNVRLNEQEETLYNAMRRKLDSLRPEIAETMRTVYNEELGTVKNYFPFMTDFEAMSDFEIRERFGNNVQEFGQAPRKNVEKGFTKKRIGGKQKIKLHAMEIFLQHIDNAAYLVTVGQHTKRLGEIAKSEEYLNSVGDKGQEIVTDWIDTISRKGRLAGERRDALDIMRKNAGLATLGFKLSSVLIQPTALLDGAALIGNHAFSGAKLIATDQNWRQFVQNNMPEVRTRIGDDPAYLEFGSNSIIDKTGRAAFWALQKLDAITASSVAAGAYIKFMEENGIEIDLENANQEAISYAQQIVRRSQAAAFFKDAPQAISRGKLTGRRSLDRLILQFQTFMLNRWSLLKHDGFALGFTAKNQTHGVNVMSYMLLTAIAETGIRGLSKELIDLFVPGGDDKEEEDGFIEKTLLNVIEMVPGVSQAVSAFTYGSVPVPSIQLAKSAIERMNAFAKSKSGDAKTRNLVRAVLLGSGFLGVPGTVQAEQIFREATGKKKRGVRL